MQTYQANTTVKQGVAKCATGTPSTKDMLQISDRQKHLADFNVSITTNMQ